MKKNNVISACFIMVLSSQSAFSAGNGALSSLLERFGFGGNNDQVITFQDVETGAIKTINTADMVSIPESQEWRENITHFSKNGPYQYSEEQEVEMEEFVDSVYEDVIEYWATPQMDFFIAEEGNQDFSIIQMTEGYQSGVITHYTITGLGPSGIAKGLVTLPVSGHTGEGEAWAKTDKIEIYAVHNGTRTLLAEGMSKDITTMMEIEVQLVAGEVVTLEYKRVDANNGYGANPSMYPESRTLKLTWDGI